MKEFAYRIEDMTKGYYMVVTFEADNETVKEFERLMRINASIVRFMIVKQDEN
ncbi:30S ribosomal protein S6 [Anaerorhabdus sp.]|uniref:30S ribosomal protein S6 n=1 Tax=Anaerorhabdus sp. TaxID=1872524 RepID=UPI003FA5C2A7